MKKIILILFLFLSCFLVYQITEVKSLSVLVLGDSISDNKYIKSNKIITEYNNNYVNKDYRIIDLLNIIKYNEELEINNKKISIHRLMKNTDIIILSIGMNDIYSKLNDNTKDIYTYINNMVNNMDSLLSQMNRYNYKQVFVLGYYNITTSYSDIFTYLNYKTKKVTQKYNFEYIELNHILGNNPDYYQKNTHFMLNNQGYNKINKIIVEKLKKY